MVPKNMTHLLRPLDLTTNASVEKMEKRAFGDHFTSTMTEVMLQNPQRDVTTIEVDLKLSTLTPMHGKLLITLNDFLRQGQGKQIILSGWGAAGITEAIKKPEVRLLCHFLLNEMLSCMYFNIYIFLNY